MGDHYSNPEDVPLWNKFKDGKLRAVRLCKYGMDKLHWNQRVEALGYTDFKVESLDYEF